MCSCSYRGGANQVLIGQGYTNIIPTRAYVNPQTGTYLDFHLYKCISKDKFINALNTITVQSPNGKSTGLGNLVLDDEDVKRLAYYADSGEDIRKWNTSIKSLLRSIKINQEEIDKSMCNIAFSIDKN